MTKKIYSIILLASLFLMSALAQAEVVRDSFYCNGDLNILAGQRGSADVLNPDFEGFELDNTKHNVVRVSLDGKNTFVKIQPFKKMKWGREGEELPSRFKFTTDKKTWFAVEAAMESEDTVRHLFCQRD